MAKGRKTGGRQKGVPNRATADVRRMIAQVAERNAAKFEKWLARAAEDDPGKAADLYLKAIEYHIPKLARLDVNLSSLPDEEVLAELKRRAQSHGAAAPGDEHAPG